MATTKTETRTLEQVIQARDSMNARYNGSMQFCIVIGPDEQPMIVSRKFAVENEITIIE